MDRHVIHRLCSNASVKERRLGIADFCQCENCKPIEEIETTASSKNDAKRLKLSLTKERSRFAPPVSDDIR